MSLRPRSERPADYPALAAVVRGLFNFRRKTLGSAAKQLAKRQPELAWVRSALIASGIDPTLRPEDLDVAGFRKITNGLPE